MSEYALVVLDDALVGLPPGEFDLGFKVAGYDALVHRQFALATGENTNMGLTPISQRNMINALVRGNFRHVASRIAGLDPSFVADWMKVGQRNREEPFCTFSELVLAAEAYAEDTLVSEWRTQASMNWQALATFLARRFPDRWSTTTTVKHEGTVDVRHSLESFHRSVEEAKLFEQQLLVDENIIDLEPETSTEVGPSA